MQQINGSAIFKNRSVNKLKVLSGEIMKIFWSFQNEAPAAPVDHYNYINYQHFALLSRPAYFTAMPQNYSVEQQKFKFWPPMGDYGEVFSTPELFPGTCNRWCPCERMQFS